MDRFFTDIDALNQFSLSLRSYPDRFQCPHCQQSDPLLSHGFIYKQHGIDQREPVGKRLFCSNRHHRRGCGRTTALYVQHTIPFLHYQGGVLSVFIQLLFAGVSVRGAYRQATSAQSDRHAFRWMDKLLAQLSVFRSVLCGLPGFLLDHHHDNAFDQQSARRRQLLPTLKQLQRLLPKSNLLCGAFQLQTQTRFF